jgi:hypothetical protein
MESKEMWEEGEFSRGMESHLLDIIFFTAV